MTSLQMTKMKHDTSKLRLQGSSSTMANSERCLSQDPTSDVLIQLGQATFYLNSTKENVETVSEDAALLTVHLPRVTTGPPCAQTLLAMLNAAIAAIASLRYLTSLLSNLSASSLHGLS